MDAPSASKLGHRQSRISRSKRAADGQVQRYTCILSPDTPPEQLCGGVAEVKAGVGKVGVEFDGGRRIRKQKKKKREKKIGAQDERTMACERSMDMRKRQRERIEDENMDILNVSINLTKQKL